MFSTNLWRSLIRLISLEVFVQSAQQRRRLQTQEIHKVVFAEDDIAELSEKRRARMRLSYEQLTLNRLTDD